MKLPVTLLSLAAAVSAFSATAPIVSAPTPYAADKNSSLDRRDAALDALIAPDAVIEFLGSGFRWAEGPIWVPAQNALLFSDTQVNRVYRFREGQGIDVAVQPSGFTGSEYNGRERGSNGLTLDAQGRLVLAQHGDRRIARLAADGHSFETVVARFEGQRFHSPNDLCYDRAGNLYFTDPPYGRAYDAKAEIPFHGVYRLGTDGRLTVITKDFARPNGLALSPDERTLYIGSSAGDAPWIKAYALDADGTVSSNRVFFDASKHQLRGAFDGFKVDAQGNVWTSGPGGILVISADGKLLGTIRTGRPTANCAFGGTDHQTLYITAGDALLRVRTKVKGAGR